MAVTKLSAKNNNLITVRHNYELETNMVDYCVVVILKCIEKIHFFITKKTDDD